MLWFALLHPGNVLLGQTFLNGDFEINTASVDVINPGNTTFNNTMSDVEAFGPAGNVDIVTSASYTGGPQSGSWFIGIHETVEDQVTLKLSAPLVSGSSYSITFWDKKFAGHPTIPFDIGLSTSATSLGTTIYTTPSPAINGTWTQRTFAFVAPNNGQYISVNIPSLANNYVQVDNFSIIPLGVSLGNDTTICLGDSLVLGPPASNATYLWQNGSTDSTFTVMQTGTYWVETTISGVTISDTIQVNVGPLGPPVVDFGNDTVLCNGSSLLLDASFPSSTYSWQTPNYTNSTFQVSTAGTYWAEATNICGTSGDTIVVSYTDPPSISLPNDTHLCNGTTVLADATYPHSTYTWSNGSSDSSLTIATSGTYWVQVNNACGSTTDTITVNFDFMPSPFLGPDTILCTGASYILNGSVSGASILWHNGSSNPNFQVVGPGKYWLQASNLCGTITDTLNVDYVNPASVELGEDWRVCKGDTVRFDVTAPGASYAWSHGPTVPDVAILLENTYSVTVTNACGSVTDSVFVEVDNPLASEFGPNRVLCQGETVVLDGTSESPDADYFWNTGDTVPIITATATGLYWLKLENGCGNFGDSIFLLFRAPPKVDFGADRIVCGEEGPGNTIELEPLESGTGYRWQDGSGKTSYEVSKEGLYWLELRNECGTSVDSVYVDYQPNPKVNLGADTFYCEHLGAIQWDLSSAGPFVEWQDGSVNSTYIPEGPGRYWANVTDEKGCLGHDEIVIDECPVYVYVPNAFSPNRDLINDVFKAEGEFVVEFEMEIFDRWGSLLFKSTDINKGWDGRVNGIMSPIGAYVYSIYYRGENTGDMSLTGTFQLVD